MTAIPSDINKTICPCDLNRSEVSAAKVALSKFARQLWWKRVPFAVNGALRMRFRRIRWNKLWEYARGLAYGDFQPGMRGLDLGGGATIPLFYLARNGCEVFSLDIDQKLANYTTAAAKQMGWRLQGSTFDLTADEAPVEWAKFDRVISFCVIEHIPKDKQRLVLQRLAGLLKPGGLLELTFDYGDGAPIDGAIRNEQEVDGIVRATGLTLLGDGKFHDTGERFAIDKKYPNHHFTFGSLFMKKM